MLTQSIERLIESYQLKIEYFEEMLQIESAKRSRINEADVEAIHAADLEILQLSTQKKCHVGFLAELNLLMLLFKAE